MMKKALSFAIGFAVVMVVATIDVGIILVIFSAIFGG